MPHYEQYTFTFPLYSSSTGFVTPTTPTTTNHTYTVSSETWVVSAVDPEAGTITVEAVADGHRQYFNVGADASRFYLGGKIYSLRTQKGRPSEEATDLAGEYSL